MVHVLAFGDSDVVGKHLEGQGSEERFEAFLCLRQFDDSICKVSDRVVTFGDNGYDTGVTSLYLLDVAEHLVVEDVFCGDDDYRHLFVDERYRSVLHLGSRVAFWVDV